MEQRKVTIIGGGPAGLTAAIYASRAMLDPLILQGAVEPGGQLTTTTDVDNFPGFPEGIMGPELIERMRQQATRFGTEIRTDWVTSVDLSRRPFRITTDQGEIETATLIIATGASAKYLGIPGEKEFLGKGVSACATCDGFFFRDQVVAVVGGGDTAMEEATFLTRFASKVYVIHRRDQLRASKIMQERAFANEKIEFVWNSIATEVLGNDQGVTAVRLKDTQTGEERELEIQGFFLGIGHK
ncbi:MAG: thioredoxin-disulfide reductase, partial [Candidatus Dadabacteria bacterium]